MYVLRCGRRCARISRRGAAPTTLLCSSTMTTISSAALIAVLVSSANNRPKKGCHRVGHVYAIIPHTPILVLGSYYSSPPKRKYGPCPDIVYAGGLPGSHLPRLD